MSGGQEMMDLPEGALGEEGRSGAKLRPLMGAFIAISGSRSLQKLEGNLEETIFWAAWIFLFWGWGGAETKIFARR